MLLTETRLGKVLADLPLYLEWEFWETYITTFFTGKDIAGMCKEEWEQFLKNKNIFQHSEHSKEHLLSCMQAVLMFMSDIPVDSRIVNKVLTHFSSKFGFSIDEQTN